MAIPEKKPKFNQPKSTSFADVNDFLSQFDKDGALIDEYDMMDPSDWASTGNYMHNMQISGSFLKGVPNNKLTVLAGDPKSGKSYVLFNIMRNFQQKGYFSYFLETENSPDKERIKNQLIDPSGVRIKQPETIGEISIMTAQLTEELLKMKAAGKEIPKVAIYIDSISVLNSSKEINDMLMGKETHDMGTKAKELKALFNMLTIRAGKLGIPIIVTAHVYEAQITQFIKDKKISGGMGPVFMASIITCYTKWKDTDKETKETTGIKVTSYHVESRYTKARNITFVIPNDRPMNPYIGLEPYISWENCGIDRGKFVDYVDLGYELILKKAVKTKEEAKDFLITKEWMEKNLSKPKKEYLDRQLAYALKIGDIKVEKGGFKLSGCLSRFNDQGYAQLEDSVGIPNSNSSQWICEHLKRVVTTKELMSDLVFTEEVMNRLDEIVSPYYRLGSDPSFDRALPSDVNDDMAQMEFYK